MAADTCRTCRFWRPFDEAVPSKGRAFATDVIDHHGAALEVPAYGECRRNPPTVSDHMASIAIQRPGFGGSEPDPEDIADAMAVERSCLWPVTYHSEWCGQHPDLEQQWSSPC